MSTIPQIKDQLVTKVDQFVQNVGYNEPPQDTTKVPESGGDQEWMMEAVVSLSYVFKELCTPSFPSSVSWLSEESSKTMSEKSCLAAFGYKPSNGARKDMVSIDGQWHCLRLFWAHGHREGKLGFRLL